MNRKQRVLLVRSNYLEGQVGKLFSPPLGILSLAGMIRRERPGRVDVQLIDMGIERLTVEKMSAIIRSWEPDVLGISTLAIEDENLHNLGQMAKETLPGITVVVGGPHSTAYYDVIMKDRNLDYAVIGEGELTLIDLLDHLYEGACPDEIPGVAYNRDGKVIFSGNRPFIEDLDSLPIPAWELLDLMPYSRGANPNGFLAKSPYASIFSSRACPYRCAYCHHIFGKKFRSQTPERTLDEIEFLSRRFGVREIHVMDDVFNLDVPRATDIMEGVVERDIDMKFAFPNGVRGDILTRNLIRSMARAGTYCMNFAVESASPRIQKLISKNINLPRLSEAVEWAYEEGIIPAGFFMFGFPTETIEEMEETVKFACRSRMLKASFSCVVPFPRTKLHDLVKECYPDYNLSYDISANLHFRSKMPYYQEITGIDVTALQQRAWKEFYINPKRIWGILSKTPKNKALMMIIWYSVIVNFLGLSRQD